MDEMTNAQNAEVDMPDADFDFENEEEFDMSAASAKAAEEMYEQQMMEEKEQFKEKEGFAAIFPDNWELLPPTVNKYAK